MTVDRISRIQAAGRGELVAFSWLHVLCWWSSWVYCCHRKQFFWDLIFGGFVCVRYRILIHDVESACLHVCIVEWYGSGMTCTCTCMCICMYACLPVCIVEWYGSGMTSCSPEDWLKQPLLSKCHVTLFGMVATFCDAGIMKGIHCKMLLPCSIHCD